MESRDEAYATTLSDNSEGSCIVYNADGYSFTITDRLTNYLPNNNLVSLVDILEEVQETCYGGNLVGDCFGAFELNDVLRGVKQLITTYIVW